MLWVFAMLLGWHALADYPLQGDFLARAKNHTAPIPGVPWYQALGAHAVIHGVGVMYITGSLMLGVGEVVVHCVIDWTKCSNPADDTTFNIDQAFHVASKLLWVALLVVWGQL